jgi:hypothetical protein
VTGGRHVTLHVWRVPRRRVPRALWRVARDRAHLRALPGVNFAKLLGTAPDGRFEPGMADSTRWAALIAWADAGAATAFEASRVATAWRSLATAHCRIDLRPVRVTGSWARQRPFVPGGHTPAGAPVLALTRARLRLRRTPVFWRAIRPVGAASTRAPGLITAFGVGEAPLGWQGTVSLWQSAHHLVEFAYRHPDHRRVIEATPERRWYAEELFARFAVLNVTGDREVIGWVPAG